MNHCIRFYFACQEIAVISLVYLIFSFYYSLFDFSHSYLYDNCVLIAAICCRKVKRCRAFIPRLKPWAFPRGFRNVIFSLLTLRMLNRKRLRYIRPSM